MNDKLEWDLFISHASEDKAAFVEPLAMALRDFGLTIWYDAMTLKLGDSLSRSIDQGLARSRFGVVVISPSFIAKGWPEYELRGLVARDVNSGTVILPIWHNVTRHRVLSFSPSLADKLAITTNALTPAEAAVRIIEIVKPELFERINLRLAFLTARENAQMAVVPPKMLRDSPIRHDRLTEDSYGRIRLI